MTPCLFGPLGKDFTPNFECAVDGLVKDGFLNDVPLIKSENLNLTLPGEFVLGKPQDFQASTLEVTDCDKVVHSRKHKRSP